MSCASVTQTCSNNGMCYLLLFAVCCSQASLSKKLLQLLLVLFCDGNALVRSDIHMATGRGEGEHKCLKVYLSRERNWRRYQVF